MSKPNKEFMLSLAIRRAIQSYKFSNDVAAGDLYRKYGIRCALDCLTLPDYVRSDFCKMVRAEFANISADLSHEVAA